MHAEERFSRHEVEIDLERRAAAQGRTVAGHPFSAGVLLVQTTHLGTLSREQGPQRGLDGGRSASISAPP